MADEDLSWLNAPPAAAPQEQPISVAELTGNAGKYEPCRPAAVEATRPARYVHQGTTYKDLTPQEARVALMRVAGASEATIALEIESDTFHVQRILARPQVAKQITKLRAQFATEAAPVIRDLNAEIEAVAADAFDRLKRNMEIFDEVGDSRLAEGDYKNGLRAKLGCVATTQDILDRAGKRAPTKSIGAVMHVVAPEQLEKLERIIGDATNAAAPDTTADRREAAYEMVVDENRGETGCTTTKGDEDNGFDR